MSLDEQAPSPSPRVPTSDRPSGSPASSSVPDTGWRPADADDSPRAVAWRARTGLRRADRALETIGALGERIGKLTTSIDGWTTTWEGHLASARRVALWALGIVGALALGGASVAAWRWLSTLHH